MAQRLSTLVGLQVPIPCLKPWVQSPTSHKPSMVGGDRQTPEAHQSARHIHHLQVQQETLTQKIRWKVKEEDISASASGCHCRVQTPKNTYIQHTHS